MSPVLTTEQIQAIQANPDGPVRVVDPQSNEAYVIVRAEVFEQMRAILKDDYQISDTYVAQMQSALRAGMILRWTITTTTTRTSRSYANRH